MKQISCLAQITSLKENQENSPSQVSKATFSASQPQRNFCVSLSAHLSGFDAPFIEARNWSSRACCSGPSGRCRVARLTVPDCCTVSARCLRDFSYACRARGISLREEIVDRRTPSAAASSTAWAAPWPTYGLPWLVRYPQYLWDGREAYSIGWQASPIKTTRPLIHVLRGGCWQSFHSRTSLSLTRSMSFVTRLSHPR